MLDKDTFSPLDQNPDGPSLDLGHSDSERKADERGMASSGRCAPVSACPHCTQHSEPRDAQDSGLGSDLLSCKLAPSTATSQQHNISERSEQK